VSHTFLFITVTPHRWGYRIVDLQRNRRSHGAIIAWPNRYIYEDRIRACGSKDVTHTMINWKWLPKRGFPIVFHGIRGQEQRAKHSYSYFNVFEASTVRDYCRKLIEDTEQKTCE
jgi:helicase MOV-10